MTSSYGGISVCLKKKKKSEFGCVRPQSGQCLDFFFWGAGVGGGRHTTLVWKHRAVLPHFFCAYHSPLASSSVMGNEKKRKKAENNKKDVKSFYMHNFSLCWQPTCMLHIESYFQKPSETIPFLSLKDFKGKTKQKRTKKPQVSW